MVTALMDNALLNNSGRIILNSKNRLHRIDVTAIDGNHVLTGKKVRFNVGIQRFRKKGIGRKSIPSFSII